MSAHAEPVETSPRRKRARRGEGSRLREQILQAAARLLIETGDGAAVSIRAIADAVGCTPPAIYMHFADKDELLLAVCEQRFRDLNRAIEKSDVESADPVESLRARGRAYIRFGVANPEHYRVLMMTRRDEGVYPGDFSDAELQGTRAFLALVGAIQRCIDAGAFRRVDPMRAAMVLWAGVHGLTSLLITVPSFPWGDTDAVVDEMLEVHIRGLRANS